MIRYKRSVESYDTLFSNTIPEPKKEEVIYSSEGLDTDKEFGVYEKLYNKIKHNSKYKADLPLKVYNFMAHGISFDGGFPRLKRFFKIAMRKDNIKSTPCWETIIDDNGDYDKSDSKASKYSFGVVFVCPPIENEVKMNKFVKTADERFKEAKKKIKETYSKADITKSVDGPFDAEDSKGKKYKTMLYSIRVEIPLTFFDVNEKSNEALFDDDIEQNNVLSFENALLSREDDDAGSFEDAADDSSGGDDSGGGDGWGDDSGGMDDSGGDDGGWGGDDSGGGDDWGGDSEDGGDDSGGDGDGESSGIDVIDNNKGSSLNPFTQINHKIYTLDTLNDLSYSIKNSLDLYTDRYADWSEVIQLKDLADIIDEEKRSFMMQQNPENDIKLGLYLEQYKILVQNISRRIEGLKSNNKI